jgi:hypothetical protein
LIGGIAGGVFVFSNKRVGDVFADEVVKVEEGGAKPVTAEAATKAARIKDRITIIIVVVQGKGKAKRMQLCEVRFFRVYKSQVLFQKSVT